MSKLTLDRDRIESCRKISEKVARNLQDVVDHHTTISVERAVLRLFGIEEAYKGRPLVDAVLNTLGPEDLSKGICYWLGRALVSQRTTPISFCLRVAEGRLRFQELPDVDPEEIRVVLVPLAEGAISRIEQAKETRKKRLRSLPPSPRPLRYVTLSTSSVEEQREEARSAILQGADCIDIGSVPHLELLPERYRLFRNLLDEISDREGRYIRLIASATDGQIAEVTTIAALEKVDYLSGDLFCDVLGGKGTVKQNLIEHQFARRVMACAGIVLNTGVNLPAASGGNYSQAIATHFLTESLSLAGGMAFDQIGLGHPFRWSPESEELLLHEMSGSCLIRELFPKAPLKYLPPSPDSLPEDLNPRFLQWLYHWVALVTGQEIFQVKDVKGDLRQLAMMKPLAEGFMDEMEFASNGKLVRRARTFLDDAFHLLQRVERYGFLKSFEEGLFGNASLLSTSDEGSIHKGDHYYNPLLELLNRPSEEETSPITHTYHRGSERGHGERRGRRVGGPPRRGHGRGRPRRKQSRK